MVFVEIVAQAGSVKYLRPAASYGRLCMDIKEVATDVQLLLKVLVIAIVAPVERYVGKRLQAACTIFQRQVVVVIPSVVSPGLACDHHTQSVALRLQRLDEDDGIHFGIVFGTWGGDDVDTLDVGRLQLFQIAHIAYLFIIDIDLRLALGQHFKLTVFALNERNHRQQVVGITDIVEQRVLHIDRHTARRHLILRNLTPHLNAFHHIGLRL